MSDFFANVLKENPKIYDKTYLPVFAFAPMEPFTANPIIRELEGYFGARLVFRPKIKPHHLIKAKKWQYKERIADYDHIKTFYNAKVYDGLQLIAKPQDPIKLAVNFINQNKNRIGIDFIDLNFGCPSQKVIAGDRGGALLRKPLILGHVIEKVLKYSDLPVSIKIRGGFTPADDLNELLKIIFNYDIAWVTLNRAPIRLNGRPKSEIYGSIKYFKQYHDYEIKYIDKSNKQLNSKKTIPLIVNGNIQIKTIDSLGLQDLEGIMIGREALENPFMYIRMFKHIMRKNENKKLKIGVGTLPENFNANILFKELIRILNKYKAQNRTTWLKLSKFKLILFHFIKYKYLKSDKRKEQKYKQIPQGLGWARWEKNKFSMDELLNVLKGAFPELQEEIFTQLKKIIIN